MNLRDKIIFGFGFLLAVTGAVTTILWTAKAGLISLLLLGFLLLFLVTLNRRQMSKLQQRTLANLHFARETNSSLVASQQETSMATKRILGILQAQQISMEMLERNIKEDFQKQ